ncbi:MAG: hypothetical protein QF752_13310 [Planctomycetota bacterium]|nr:hypothetical protein [Planctomycetota bacterium]
MTASPQPTKYASRRESVQLVIMLLLALVFGGVTLNHYLKENEKSPQKEPLPAQPLNDPTTPDPSSSPFDNPDQSSAQIPPEKLATMLEHFRSVEDGSERLFGTPFFDLLWYVQRLDWKEAREQASRTSATKLIWNGAYKNTAPGFTVQQQLWQENRGQFFRLVGTVIHAAPMDLPKNTSGFSKVQSLIVLSNSRQYNVLLLDSDQTVSTQKRTVFYAAFFKDQKRTLQNGSSFHIPILIAKEAGSGPAKAEVRIGSPIDTSDVALKGYLSEVRNIAYRDKYLHTDAYYALIHSTRTNPPSNRRQNADPDLLSKLWIPMSKRISTEYLKDMGRRVWSPCRGLSTTIRGTVLYLEKEIMPEGKIPGSTVIYRGMLGDSEYRLWSFAVSDIEGIKEKDLVSLEGSFLTILRYKDQKNRWRNSPFFVGRNLVRVTPREDNLAHQFILVAGLILLGVICTLILATRRESRQANDFRKDWDARRARKRAERAERAERDQADPPAE